MAEQEGPLLSPEEAARFAKAARQLIAYMNFMRWSANFRRDEVINHPQHSQVVLLSPMQSARFSYAMDHDTAILGVQNFEAAWAAAMPFDAAYVSDRLYLRVKSVSILSGQMPDLTIGIYFNDRRKLAEIAKASFLQLMRVEAQDGLITSVGRAMGLGVPIHQGDIIKALSSERKLRQQQLDVGRFF